MQPSKRWHTLVWRFNSLVSWERPLIISSTVFPPQLRYYAETKTKKNKKSKVLIVIPPDRKLVYLHCSSIFKGANARVRKIKTIIQLLNKHRTSIKILTDQSPLSAIASVAKSLLEQGIFELQPRARLHFPDLFQPSERQEAQREASEAKVAKSEAETVQETAVNSDEQSDKEIAATQTREDQQSPKVAEPEAIKQDAHNPPAEDM